MKRKAVSDIIASVILIAIVVVAFAGIVYPLLIRYQRASTSLFLSQQKKTIEAETLISPVYSYVTQSGSQTTFYLYFYNYGKYAFTPNEFIVQMPNVGTFTVTSFSMLSPSGTSVSTMAPGTVTEVVFSIQYSNAVPSAYNVTAVGNGFTISWEI